MTKPDDDDTPLTIEDLDERLKRLERRLGMVEGNVEVVGTQEHELTDFYERIRERVARLERVVGIPSPIGDEPLTAEQAAILDKPEDD